MQKLHNRVTCIQPVLQAVHMSSIHLCPLDPLQHLAPGHGVNAGSKPADCQRLVCPVPVTCAVCISSHHHQHLLGIKIVLQQHSNLGLYFLNLSSFF